MQVVFFSDYALCNVTRHYGDELQALCLCWLIFLLSRWTFCLYIATFALTDFKPLLSKRQTCRIHPNSSCNSVEKISLAFLTWAAHLVRLLQTFCEVTTPDERSAPYRYCRRAISPTRCWRCIAIATQTMRLRCHCRCSAQMVAQYSCRSRNSRNCISFIIFSLSYFQLWSIHNQQNIHLFKHPKDGVSYMEIHDTIVLGVYM